MKPSAASPGDSKQMRHGLTGTVSEWVAIFRRDALLAIDGYDEARGPGCATPWLANEGQDVTLRLLEAGYKTYYDLYGFQANDKRTLR